PKMAADSKRLDSSASFESGEEKLLDEIRKKLQKLSLIYTKSEHVNAQILIVSIEKSLLEQENALHGTVITGEKSFLAPYNTGKKNFKRDLTQLKQINSHNIDEKGVYNKIEKLEGLMFEWQKKAALVEIETRRKINTSGLSDMEFLQSILATNQQGDELKNNQDLLAGIQKNLISLENTEGLLILSALDGGLKSLQASFLEMMFSGSETHQASFFEEYDHVEALILKLSVFIHTQHDKTLITTSQSAINRLRSLLNQWYRGKVLPAFKARTQLQVTRSSALSEIQNVVKQGKGKVVLGEIRGLLDRLSVDFEDAGNTTGINLVLHIGKYLVDQETSQRGFIITGDESFLELYVNGNKGLRRSLAELENLTRQSFVKTSTLAQLNKLKSEFSQWEISEVNAQIELRRRVNSAELDFSEITQRLLQSQDKQMLSAVNYEQSALQQLFIKAKNQQAQWIVMSISKSIVEMHAAQRAYLIGGKEHLLQPFHRAKNKLVKHFDALHNMINSSYDIEDVIGNIEQVRLKSELWRSQTAEPEIAMRRQLTIDVATMHDVTRLIETEVGKKLIEAIKSDIDQFIEVAKNLNVIRSTEAEKAAQLSIIESMVATAIALCIVIVAAFYLLRTIVNSLRYLASATERVSQGDYSLVIETQGHDEIADLTHAFNRMTLQLGENQDSMQASKESLEKQAVEMQNQTFMIEMKNQELVDTQDELEKHALELSQASQYKTEFLANMSHEIRTPMNAIVGFSRRMLKSDLNESQLDYMHKIEISSESLLDIINDILDFSKIESGKMELESIEFDLSKVIHKVMSIISVKAQENELELLLDKPPSLPNLLIGDALRLQQVLINLCTNAVKFTRSGHVLLRVELINSRVSENIFKFSVEDTGIGIAEDKIDTLFDSFSQADTSITRDFGGTGLGLTISKRLVELMGGEIRISSEEGLGSCFSFTANFASCKQDRPDDRKYIAIKTALVVDDNAAARLVMDKLLQAYDICVTLCNSGEDALALLQDSECVFDLIILDWKMPGLNGIETAREIQLLPEVSNKPVLMMTSAFDNPGVRAEAAAQGIDKFISKPVSPSDFLNSLNDFYPANKSNIDKQAMKQDWWQDGSLSGRRILLVEDNVFNQQVAEEILHESGIVITIANNGEECLACLEKSSFDLILMDIQMPVMDGYTAIKEIRKQDRWKNLPVIAMTAHAMAEDREKSSNAGMNEHVSKPIDVDILYEMLARFIPVNHSPLLSEVATLSDEPVELATPGLELEQGLKRVRNNKALYLKLCHLFIQDYKDAYQEIDAYIADKNYLLLAELCHKVKGTSGTLGANDLMDKVATLETLAGGEIHPDAKDMTDLEHCFDQTLTSIHAVILWLDKPKEEADQDACDIPALLHVLNQIEKDMIAGSIIPDDVLMILSDSTLQGEGEQLRQQLVISLDQYDYEQCAELIHTLKQYLVVDP
ncbi:MAG: response regulator, partial [Pseudomonadales bacterium]|nr:response regulator [Pseudomonadales bacterium]